MSSTVAKAQVINNSASTAGEGYQRGAASIIQAQGQRNLSNSQAAINLTDARSNQIDNQVKSVNAFWEKKDIYDQRQQEEFAKIGAKRSAYMEKPNILVQKEYDQYRITMDELFKKRAYAGALTGDEYMEATAASKAWRAMLSGQSKVYPAPILSQMIRFILKLDRELNDNLG